MPTTSVLFDSFNPATDGKTKRSTVQFLVGYDPATELSQASPDAALDAPGVPKVGSGLQLGDPYGPDTKLFADAKRVTANLNGYTFVVEVNYSTDRSFKYPERTPRDLPGYKGQGSDIRRKEIEIPAYAYQKIRTYDDTGASVLDSNYVKQSYKEDIVEWLYTVEVTLFGVTGAMLLSIARKVNQIHRFPDGTEHLFEGIMVNQTGADTFSGVYRWSSHETIRPPTSTDSNLLLPSVPLFFYEKYVVTFDPAFIAGAPIISKVSRYSTENLNDWVGLPGNPIG